MQHANFRTPTKVVVTSLIVGTILAHFGITAEQLMHEVELSADCIKDYARKGFAWAWPSLLLGALVILPIWFPFYILRPPGPKPRITHPSAAKAGRSRRAAPRLVMNEAVIVTTATTTMMMVQMALISGFTPKRTSE